MKRALITGITGQDGSYLSELLLKKGYEVHGIIRRSSNFNTQRIDHIFSELKLHYGDMTDSTCLFNIIEKYKPDEIYNLSAQSHVGVSFEVPEYTAQADAIGVLRILEAIRQINPDIRFYQASTSEMFGNNNKLFLNEKTPFNPCSPYGSAKLFAHNITHNYRESYGIFACCGILFNHESERRGNTFVTKKICNAVAKINSGSEEILRLGNLDSMRDWGYAPEYVEMMWKMLQRDKCEDFVISTDEAHTVREFVEKAFEFIGVKIEWKLNMGTEWGLLEGTDHLLVVQDDRNKRPNELKVLRGLSTKARRELSWSPKVQFDELVKIMMEYALQDDNNRVTINIKK